MVKRVAHQTFMDRDQDRYRPLSEALRQQYWPNVSGPGEELRQGRPRRLGTISAFAGAHSTSTGHIGLRLASVKVRFR